MTAFRLYCRRLELSAPIYRGTVWGKFARTDLWGERRVTGASTRLWSISEDKPAVQVKADALHAAEGSSPGCAMASIQDTTGVLDQGMYSRG